MMSRAWATPRWAALGGGACGCWAERGACGCWAERGACGCWAERGACGCSAGSRPGAPPTAPLSRPPSHHTDGADGGCGLLPKAGAVPCERRARAARRPALRPARHRQDVAGAVRARPRPRAGCMRGGQPCCRHRALLLPPSPAAPPSRPPRSAVAGEAGATFIALNASEFVEMFVGVGASRVRDLFSQVRPAGPVGSGGCAHRPGAKALPFRAPANRRPPRAPLVLLRRRALRPPPSSSSMNSTPWAAPGTAPRCAPCRRRRRRRAACCTRRATPADPAAPGPPLPRSGGAKGNDERDQTLNQLLSEMDGFDNDAQVRRDGRRRPTNIPRVLPRACCVLPRATAPRRGLPAPPTHPCPRSLCCPHHPNSPSPSPSPARPQVVVMAATNRRDILDSALIRPGRFDRIVYVPSPDYNGRQEIMQAGAGRRGAARGGAGCWARKPAPTGPPLPGEQHRTTHAPPPSPCPALLALPAPGASGPAAAQQGPQPGHAGVPDAVSARARRRPWPAGTRAARFCAPFAPTPTRLPLTRRTPPAAPRPPPPSLPCLQRQQRRAAGQSGQHGGHGGGAARACRDPAG